MAQRSDSSGSEVQSTGVFTPTRVLAGKYRLGRMLGSGGMGAVYEAEHVELGSRVAVKLLSETGITDPVALARFRREAKAMGAIRHENVVTVMDTGTDDGVPFLVMELLEGESLDAMLRRERAIAPGLACWITRQLLSGLAAAHAVEVVHRDLKPGNVFITESSSGTHRVKILDFGISKLGDATATMNVTADGALLGTPNFMAPEQVQANVPLDGRVDIYAAGVILYRMVCGRLPYVGSSAEEVYRRILEARPTPPSQYQPDMSAELELIILRAMHPDRQRRFSDAASFAAALREVMPEAEQPLTTSLPTPPPASVEIQRPPPTQDLEPASGDYATPPAGGETYHTAPVAGDAYAMRATVETAPSARRLAGQGPPVAHRRPRRSYAIALVLGGVVAVAAASAVLALTGEDRGANEAVAPAGEAIRFGIIRHKAPEAIARELRPLTDYLAERVERPVELVILDNYKDVANELLAGKIDLGALSAYSYVRAKGTNEGLRLLATPVTHAGTTYEGYVLARAGEGISELADLAGKVFCYVSENSTSGYIYPRALFRSAGMDPDSAFKATRFTTDHTASIRALDTGACDGAAVYDSAWHQAEDQGIEPTRFTIVAKTERIPWDAYAVSESLDDATAEALADALTDLAVGSPAAKEVLLDTDSRFIGFHPGDDSLYDPVRKIETYLAEEPQLDE